MPRLIEFVTREAWKAARSKPPWRIGASTAAKICSGKQCEAWCEAKLGTSLDAKAMPWLTLGQCLESGIIDAGRRIHGWTLRDFSQTNTLVHDDIEWASATLDAERDDLEPGEPVNAKNVGTMAQAYMDYRNGLMPDLHTLQGNWECFVTGAKRFHILALVGGAEVVPFTIDRDDRVIAGMFAACSEFRERYLIGDEEPEPDATPETARAFAARVAYEEGAEILFDGKVAEAAIRLTEIEAERKPLDEEEAQLKNVVRQAMATAKVGRAPNGVEWAWTEGKVRQLRRKAVRA